MLGSVAKRTSRLVRIPTSRPSVSTTGMPLMRHCAISARASASVWSGPMVTGLTTIPASNFFTLRTWATCSSMVRFLWITPMPPCCAIAIAMGPSLTVSMAAASSGMFSLMVRVRRVLVSVRAGSTCE